MRLSDIQKKLDRHKWIASEATKEDMSGSMPYCRWCSHEDDGFCRIPHVDRIETNECAKAYNRYRKLGNGIHQEKNM